MSTKVEQMSSRANLIYTATDTALREDWDRKENLQFPKLVSFVLSRLGETEADSVDYYVRDFVRNSPEDYRVSRGAKGGIMLASVYEERQAKKAEVKALIDEKVAAKQATVSETV